MNFDEKSGEIRSYTKWGSWHQTMDTVYVLVDVPRGTRGRDVRCEISANVLKLTVQGQEFISATVFPQIVDGVLFVQPPPDPVFHSSTVHYYFFNQGNLFAPVVVDDCVWTLEDSCLVRIALWKSSRVAGNCWKSLLKGQYEAEVKTFDDMEKKMTLERYQRENPGFDFSKADITGNYHGGGPPLPPAS